MAVIFGTFGNDNILGTVNNDKIFGLLGDDILKGNEGDDKLFGSWFGKNHLYGETDAIVITLDDILNGTQVELVYGDDKLYGGLLKDVMAGDLGAYTLEIFGNDHEVAVLTGDLNTPELLLGHDKLYGWHGNDVMAGDILDMNIIIKSGNTALDKATSVAGLEAIYQIKAGDDVLNGGHGNDKIYGDGRSLLIDLESGTVDGIGELVFDEFGTLVDVLFAESQAVYSDNLFEYGHDTLIGGHGKDTLVGDLGTLDVAAKSGIVLEGSYYAASSAFLTKNSFIMGNDTLIGDHGNDKLIGDIEYLNLTLEAGAVLDAGIPTFGVSTFSNVQSGPRDENDNIYQMGDDILKGGKGRDLMAGDFDMINITAIAGVAGGIIPVTNVFLTDRYLSGDDLLEGGKGRDEMYGDGINITLNLTPGESLAGSVQAQSNVHVGITYEYGDDIMKGGKGHDLMVGDLGVYQVLVNPGNAEGDAPRVSVSGAFSSVDVFGNSDEDQNQHLYGNDIMDGEKGDDKMVGDVITFDLDLQASTSLGANAFVVFDWGGQFGTTDAYATFGDDIMNGGKGDNEMIGDVENMRINGESNICSAFCFSRYEDAHIDYGNDTLIADMGNDKIYGDVKNLEVTAQGGTCLLVEDRSGAFCSAIFSRNTWDFGADIIDSGKGHDIVVGDLDELNLNGLGGEALGIQCGAIGSMQEMSFTFGNDLISSFGGNNMLTGDVAKMNFNAVGNIVASAGSQSAGALLLNQFVLGNDVIEGGVNQDYIWGDTQTMSFNLLSDQAIGLNEFAPPPFGSAISEGDIAGNLYISGDDQILGRGGHDLIYGDVERLEITSTAGEAVDGAFSRTVFVGNQFKFGEDIIDAGRGNDIIFADLDVLDIDLAAGLATGGVGLTALWGSIASMQSNAVIFGNDQVAGGDGHDFIVGDLGSFNFMTDTVDGNDNSLVVADSNLIVLGNDFLDGGADNDVIYGDIIDTTDIQAFLDYDVFNEILLPGAPVTIPTGPLGNNMIQGGDDIIRGGAGDDIMIGGYGEDSFVYDDLFDDGDLDRILDFNTDDDQLVAQDGVLLTDGGLNIDGDLLINVSNAAVTDFSTIILQDITDFAAVDIVVA